MILKGILDQSLGQVCIRGYAPLGDLEKVSRADFLFQRNLIAKQKQTIIKFLDNNPNLFFPEVILSYVVKYRFPKKSSKESFNPIQKIFSGGRFTSNVDKISFRTKQIREGSGYEATLTQVTTIEIDSANLAALIEQNQQPFLRIDGNHRLSAADAFKDRPTVTGMNAPFCLILLPDENPEAELRVASKFEKTVFHNINSKSVPLTPEEIYRVVIDDEKNFTDSELKSNSDFGAPYLFTRRIWKKIKPHDFPSIEYLLYNPKEKSETIRTVLVNFFTILLSYGVINKNFAKTDLVKRTLQKVEQHYTDYPMLQQSQADGLLVAFLYFTFRGNKFNLGWFTEWVLENLIYELKEVSPYDLIAIFNKLIDSKNRTIFISMKFNDDDCENHFEFIKKVVKEINDEEKAGIRIYPLRIDRFKDGSAYKIPDTILNKIYESGLLIADLTHKNENVYHEIGYLMGLHRVRNRKKLNLILICNTTITKIPNEIGFNIRNHKILPFKDTNKLEQPLKDEIKNFYFKNG